MKRKSISKRIPPNRQLPLIVLGISVLFVVATIFSINNNNEVEIIEPEENQKPIAIISDMETTHSAGQYIDFNASESYDPDGEITSYEWNFGDGGTDTGNEVTYYYDDGGVYIVNLKVYDDDGDFGIDTIVLYILGN